jgi:hypothetical protein
VVHEVNGQVEHGDAKGKQDEELSYSPAAWDESASLQATGMHVDDPQSLPVMGAFPRAHFCRRAQASLHEDALRQ